LCVGAFLVASLACGCGGNVVVDPGGAIANGGAGNNSGTGASGNGSSGGPSGNLCTEIGNALLAASKGNGCSALATAAMAYEAQATNCPSAAVDQQYVTCYLSCIKLLTDCTSPTQLTAFATCYGGCKP
jgi:hypothetical protein